MQNRISKWSVHLYNDDLASIIYGLGAGSIHCIIFKGCFTAVYIIEYYLTAVACTCVYINQWLLPL